VPDGTTAPVEHVIAAVDASPAAEQVVAGALRVARAHRAALTLVHVLSPCARTYNRLLASRRDTDGSGERVTTSEAAHRDAMYARLAWLARDAGADVACRIAVPVGDAGREIIELVRRSAPSVVVVGKRGADAAPVGSLGSVARDLLARCPSVVLALDVRVPNVVASGAPVAGAPPTDAVR
jgi:nucleotide-binding universal stress UspA family protein